MNFGVPSKKQRRKREEKYPNTAVMTLSEDAGKGKSKHIIFNDKACEMLGLSEKKATVVFSFEDGKITVGNGNQAGVPEQYAINVTKNAPRRISHKKTYEYISGLLDLDNNVENEFRITNTLTTDSITMFNVNIMTDDVDTQADAKDVETVDETADDTVFDFQNETQDNVTTETINQ